MIFEPIDYLNNTKILARKISWKSDCFLEFKQYNADRRLSIQNALLLLCLNINLKPL